MKWGFRRQEPLAAGRELASPNPPAEEEGRYSSPALKLLLEALPKSGKIELLDLGMASPENLAFFGERSVRLQIADLAATLATPEARGGLEVPAGRQFDAVLAWDLFDHLDKDGAATLAARLAELTRPGGKVFLLASHQKEIAEQPLRFKMRADSTLRFVRRSRHSKLGPRRSAREIALLFPDFETEASFLLRLGWQEFLLVRGAENKAQPVLVP